MSWSIISYNLYAVIFYLLYPISNPVLILVEVGQGIWNGAELGVPRHLHLPQNGFRFPEVKILFREKNGNKIKLW